jgi:hypothetical protein
MNAPFQTMDEVNDYLSGDTITCLLCGRRLQRLHKHLYGIHDLSPDEYRTQFGIPYRRSLTSAPSRARTRDANTPERVEVFRQLAKNQKHTKPHAPPKPNVPATRNLWKKNAELGRYFSRTQVAAQCAKCGVEILTTALIATQPVRCMECTTAAAQKARRHYWRHKLAA